MSFKVYHFDMNKYICMFNNWYKYLADEFGNVYDRKDCERPSMEEYELVAEVDAETIEDVFRLTNHIDIPWMKNPEVETSLAKSRSTSVGDIVEYPNGDRVICCSMGWYKLDEN